MTPIGRTRWAIAEGWIPPESTGDSRALTSHETYASVIESDVPVVVQHTRLDSWQAALALLTTVAFGADA